MFAHSSSFTAAVHPAASLAKVHLKVRALGLGNAFGIVFITWDNVDMQERKRTQRLQQIIFNRVAAPIIYILVSK